MKSVGLLEHEREKAAAEFRRINAHVLYVITTTISCLMRFSALNENIWVSNITIIKTNVLLAHSDSCH